MRLRAKLALPCSESCNARARDLTLSRSDPIAPLRETSRAAAGDSACSSNLAGFGELRALLVRLSAWSRRNRRFPALIRCGLQQLEVSGGSTPPRPIAAFACTSRRMRCDAGRNCAAETLCTPKATAADRAAAAAIEACCRSERSQPLALDPAALTAPQLLQPPLVLYFVSHPRRQRGVRASVDAAQDHVLPISRYFSSGERRFAGDDFRIKKLDGFSVGAATLPLQDETGHGDAYALLAVAMGVLRSPSSATPTLQPKRAKSKAVPMPSNSGSALPV